MPSRNLLQILYPKPGISDLYNKVTDLIQTNLLSKGTAPSTLDLQESIKANQTLLNNLPDGNQKREVAKNIERLKNQQSTIQVQQGKLGMDNLEKDIESALTDASEAFANDPFSYVEAIRGVYRKAIMVMDNTLGSIPEKNYSNYTDINRFNEKHQEYTNKLNYELNDLSNAMKKQDSNSLKFYGVYYSPSSNGFLNMSVGLSKNKPSNSKSAGIKTAEGLPVYFVDPKPLDDTSMKTLSFGNSSFRYISALQSFQKENTGEFDWSSVKKKSSVFTSWGDFIKDSSGNKYFTMKDGSLAPISDEMTKQLGGDDSKFQNMTSDEESNWLPSVKKSSVAPWTAGLEKMLQESVTLEERSQEMGTYGGAFTSLNRLFGREAQPQKREEIEKEFRGKYSIEKFLPPKEKAATQERTKEIFKSEF